MAKYLESLNHIQMPPVGLRWFIPRIALVAMLDCR